MDGAPDVGNADGAGDVGVAVGGGGAVAVGPVDAMGPATTGGAVGVPGIEGVSVAGVVGVAGVTGDAVDEGGEVWTEACDQRASSGLAGSFCSCVSAPSSREIRSFVSARRLLCEVSLLPPLEPLEHMNTTSRLNPSTILLAYGFVKTISSCAFLSAIGVPNARAATSRAS